MQVHTENVLNVDALRDTETHTPSGFAGAASAEIDGETVAFYDRDEYETVVYAYYSGAFIQDGGDTRNQIQCGSRDSDHVLRDCNGDGWFKAGMVVDLYCGGSDYSNYRGAYTIADTTWHDLAQSA